MPPAESNPETFEVALERLERLVEQLEGGRVPLDVLVNRYEEGIQLLAECENRLREAELRIEMLTRQADGNRGLRPVDTPSLGKSETPTND